MTATQSEVTTDPGLEHALQTARDLFGHSGEAMAVIDRQLYVHEWTPRLEQLSGLRRSQLIGASITRVLADHRTRVVREALEGRMQTLKGQCFALPETAQDTRFDSYFLPLQDATGRVVACAGLVRDSASGPDVREQLYESEQRFRTMADSAPVLLWMAGTDARCDFFNQTWLDFRGRTYAQEFGFGWAEGVHPEDFQNCMDVYMDAFRERSEFEMVYRLRRRDGAYRWILDHGVPRFGATHEFLGYIGSCTDITDRKDAEDALRKTSERLARSNAELERFAHAASHDLQEPLRMVINFTGLLAENYRDVLDADGRQYIAFASDGARRMKDLIDGLLALATVKQTDKQRFGYIDTQRAVHHAMENLRLVIEESGAEIDVGPLPPVHGHGSLLVQLFQNILHNAMKFRRQEPPRIQVRAEPGEPFVRFSITDNGIGMDMRYAERVFVIFQRLHSRSEYPGSGIGLGLCKQIVEVHEGKIWLESEVGRGTTVHFTLPAELRRKSVSPSMPASQSQSKY